MATDILSPKDPYQVIQGARLALFKTPGLRETQFLQGFDDYIGLLSQTFRFSAEQIARSLEVDLLKDGYHWEARNRTFINMNHGE